MVIKNNSTLFPKAPLLAVLTARHPTRMAGHWVTFKSEIEGVKMIAIACAWSNRDITHVLSTVGNATPCKDPHVSCDPNIGFEGGDTKEHQRPDIIDFLFRFLPAIDTFNKL